MAHYTMSGTTDHSAEIEALRELADNPHGDDVVADQMLVVTIAAFRTAADLLEVHDHTGISLDNWTGPRQLVEACLKYLNDANGDEAYTFLTNGV